MHRIATLLACTALLAVAGCTSESPSEAAGLTPEEVLAEAKQTLDDTSGVRVTLVADELPEGVTGITRAEGVGTHDPAFDGTLTVVLGGASFDVPVIAVDDVVHAQVPLAPGWQVVEPEEYGAPDPARLMSTEGGLSSLLPATEDVVEGESVRGGDDNSEVLTEYSGTVAAEAVGNVIPSAEGTFEATYTVSEDGELREARLTGVFYPDTEAMTYTVGFTDYGAEPTITAP